MDFFPHVLVGTDSHGRVWTYDPIETENWLENDQLVIPIPSSSAHGRFHVISYETFSLWHTSITDIVSIGKDDNLLKAANKLMVCHPDLVYGMLVNSRRLISIEIEPDNIASREYKQYLLEHLYRKNGGYEGGSAKVIYRISENDFADALVRGFVATQGSRGSSLSHVLYEGSDGMKEEAESTAHRVERAAVAGLTLTEAHEYFVQKSRIEWRNLKEQVAAVYDDSFMDHLNTGLDRNNAFLGLRENLYQFTSFKSMEEFEDWECEDDNGQVSKDVVLRCMNQVDRFHPSKGAAELSNSIGGRWVHDESTASYYTATRLSGGTLDWVDTQAVSEYIEDATGGKWFPAMME